MDVYPGGGGSKGSSSSSSKCRIMGVPSGSLLYPSMWIACFVVVVVLSGGGGGGVGGGSFLEGCELLRRYPKLRNE